MPTRRSWPSSPTATPSTRAATTTSRSALSSEGAVVYAPDHTGHGLSEGERALVQQGEGMTADLHLVAEIARGAHPGLPVVLIGHSMGGLIATRYAQTHQGELDALVLSGPVIGGNPEVQGLLDARSDPRGPDRPGGPLARPRGRRRVHGRSARLHGPVPGARPSSHCSRPWTASTKGRASATCRCSGSTAPTTGSRRSSTRERRWSGFAVQRTEEKVYEGARHEIFNETNQDEVLDDTVEFLRRTLE